MKVNLMVSNKLSPDENLDLNTKSNNSGDTRYTGDKFKILMDEKEKDNTNTRATSNSYMDNLIGYREPFYYSKEHPKVENIHIEAIEATHIVFYFA